MVRDDLRSKQLYIVYQFPLVVVDGLDGLVRQRLSFAGAAGTDDATAGKYRGSFGGWRLEAGGWTLEEPYNVVSRYSRHGKGSPPELYTI